MCECQCAVDVFRNEDNVMRTGTGDQAAGKVRWLKVWGRWGALAVQSSLKGGLLNLFSAGSAKPFPDSARPPEKCEQELGKPEGGEPPKG